MSSKGKGKGKGKALDINYTPSGNAGTEPAKPWSVGDPLHWDTTHPAPSLLKPWGRAPSFIKMADTSPGDTIEIIGRKFEVTDHQAKSTSRMFVLRDLETGKFRLSYAAKNKNIDDNFDARWWAGNKAPPVREKPKRTSVDLKLVPVDDEGCSCDDDGVHAQFMGFPDPSFETHLISLPQQVLFDLLTDQSNLYTADSSPEFITVSIPKPHPDPEKETPEQTRVIAVHFAEHDSPEQAAQAVSKQKSPKDPSGPDETSGGPRIGPSKASGAAGASLLEDTQMTGTSDTSAPTDMESQVESMNLDWNESDGNIGDNEWSTDDAEGIERQSHGIGLPSGESDQPEGYTTGPLSPIISQQTEDSVRLSFDGTADVEPRVRVMETVRVVPGQIQTTSASARETAVQQRLDAALPWDQDTNENVRPSSHNSSVGHKGSKADGISQSSHTSVAQTSHPLQPANIMPAARNLLAARSILKAAGARYRERKARESQEMRDP